MFANRKRRTPARAINFRRALIESLEQRLCMALDVPQFSSLAGADHTIYLDFDGHTMSGTVWNTRTGQATMISPAYSADADASDFSPVELADIEDAWLRVAEDFAPFEVNVTTVEPPVSDLIKSGVGDTRWGIRVLITQDTYDICTCAGWAYFDSFNWNTDTPVMVILDGGNYVLGGGKDLAEAASHEVGHSLGLTHDGRTLSNGSTETYYFGHDESQSDEQFGWAPIMGAGNFADLTQWDQGEYFQSNNTSSTANLNRGADDLHVMSTYNGFGYRADDHGDSRSVADALPMEAGQISVAGLIGRTGESDWFQFTTDAGPVQILVDPAAVGANLDVQADLYDASGSLLLTSNPVEQLNAVLAADLAAGQYFLRVSPVGQGTPAANPPSGYSNYGSLGQYTITGSVTPVNADILSITPTDAVRFEGNTASAGFTFTVSRTGDLSGTTTANYAVSAGSENPVNAGDFPSSVWPTGTVMFAPGEATKTIVIPVRGETTEESDEQFVVSLSVSSGMTRVAQGYAFGTIRNDDGPPKISVVATDLNKVEGTGAAATPFTFTLMRTGNISSAASVLYTVAPSGASKVNASDFVGGLAKNVKVNFAANQASATITLNVVADNTRESNEGFQVTLSKPVNMTIATGSVIGAILDDDTVAAGGSSFGAEDLHEHDRPAHAVSRHDGLPPNSGRALSPYGLASSIRGDASPDESTAAGYASIVSRTGLAAAFAITESPLPENVFLSRFAGNNADHAFADDEEDWKPGDLEADIAVRLVAASRHLTGEVAAGRRLLKA